MRRKFSTLVEESLLERARVEAARQGRQIADIVGAALTAYLDRPTGLTPRQVVEESWAVLPMSAREVREVLAQEDDYLNA